MYRMLLGITMTAMVFGGSALGQSGQSLGDIARANREKLQAQDSSGTRPKVITNADLPENSTGIPEPDASEPMTMVSGVSRPFENRYSDQRMVAPGRNEQHAGDQWRERILAQESRIADLQARIDQVNASMHSTSSAQYEGPYNRYQARQMQHIAQMQEALDQQRRKLAMMQDAARHAGMHTTVYDP
jgi:hypothetical protein